MWRMLLLLSTSGGAFTGIVNRRGAMAALIVGGTLACHHFSCHSHEATTINFPSTRLRFALRSLLHRPEPVPIAREQLEFAGNRFARANGNNETISSILNDVRAASVRGSDNRRALRHRFQDHQ